MKKLMICLAPCAFLPRPLCAQERTTATSPKKIRANRAELHYLDGGKGEAEAGRD